MPTLSTSPLTVLAAVNLMLRNASLGKADSLQAQDTNEDLRDCLRELEDVSKTIQVRGWRFNTLSGYTVDPNTDGTITIPPNFHAVRMAGTSTAKDYTLRGRDGSLLLYDTKANTFAIGSSVCLDAIRVDDFEDLPPILRTFVAYTAAFQFAARKSAASTSLRINEADVRRAEADWEATDGWEDDRDLSGTSPHFAKFRRR